MIIKRTNFLFILAALFEIFIPFAWVLTKSFFIPILLHIFGVAIMIVSVMIRNISGEDQRLIPSIYWYAVLIIFFFPFFGIFAAMLLVGVLYFFSKRIKSNLYKDYEEYIEKIRVERLDRRILGGLMRKVREEVSFEPFIDIIRGNNIKTKERTIEKLSHIDSADSVKLLKEALRDPSAEVRLYAAAALLKMESAISEKIQIANKRVKERGSSRDYSYLGDLYRTYAQTGLLERNSALRYYSLACDNYQASLDLETNQVEVILHYVNVLIVLDRFKKAKQLLDRATKVWPQNNEIVFLRAQVYFMLGNYKEIKDIISSVKIDFIDDQKREILEIWKS